MLALAIGDDVSVSGRVSTLAHLVDDVQITDDLHGLESLWLSSEESPARANLLESKLVASHAALLTEVDSRCAEDTCVELVDFFLCASASLDGYANCILGRVELEVNPLDAVVVDELEAQRAVSALEAFHFSDRLPHADGRC